MTRKRNQFCTIWMVAGMAALLGLMFVESTQAQRRRRRRRPDPIKVGQIAPDFELPTLKSVLTNIKDGKVDEDKLEKVKLSAFRGKRPVCLLFTSCT